MNTLSIRWVALLAAGLAAAGCADRRLPLDPQSGEVPAPFDSAGVLAAPGRYIVVLRPGASDPAGVAFRAVVARGGLVHHTYQAALHGLAATLPPDALRAVKNDPDVAYVEPDWIVTVAGSQTNPPWGLDRIDQRDLPLSGAFGWSTDGTGITIYIIDTGILATHADFGGRASVGFDASGGDGVDCHGHGTHVAGIAAGQSYGVAKGASVVGVRVFGDCSGSTLTSRIIAGVDWVTANASRPAVANMSLGGSPSRALDDAIRASVSAGVTYAVAAGNEASDACASSPARLAEAITVGATTSADERASYSNWGPCVDIFAPGSSIRSAYYTGSTATATMSGTSMASPHVAGAAALWLEANPTAVPAAVTEALLASGSAQRLTNVPNGTINLFLFTGLSVEPGARIEIGPTVLEAWRVREAPGFAADEPARGPAAAAPLRLAVRNTGDQDLGWTAEDNASWVSVSPTAGSLAPGAAETLLVEIASPVAFGTYEALVRVSGPDAVNSPVFATARLYLLPGGRLLSGSPVPDIWGDARDASRHFRIGVPVGTSRLEVEMSGGTGDADLYVREGTPPSLSDWDCRPYLVGNSETCSVENPAPGDWWVMLDAYTSYDGVTLVATTTPVPPPAAPSGLTAALAGPSTISLAWTDNSGDEDRFELAWRSKPVGGTYGAWTAILPPLAAGVTSHTRTGLAASTVHQHRVRACVALSCSPWVVSTAVTTPAATAAWRPRVE